MKIRPPLLPLLILLSFLLGCTCLQGQTKNAIFQVSAISASVGAADYDGKFTMTELKKHGDFGIGIYDGFDGEMVGLDGQFYQARADGITYPVEGSMKTPFACVTFFQMDKTFSSDKSMNYKELEQYLDGLLPNKKIFYAIKISGDFNYIQIRTGPKQSKPYPQVAEVLKNQTIYELRDAPGVMVGFYLPKFMGAVNPPGYHFHFLSGELKKGGHLLDCQLKKVKIEIGYIHNFNLFLPQD